MAFFSLNEIDTKKRYPDIDSLRGLGVILMFLGHAFAWWLPRTQYGANDLYWYIRILSGLSPILFLFVLGYSMVLYNIRRRASSLPPDYLKLARRGGFLLLLGYGMNFLIFQFTPDQGLWTANILHTLGLCIWSGLFFLWAPSPLFKLSAIGIILLTSPWLQEVSFPQWASSTFEVWLIGLPYHGYFPFFPWSTFALLGMLMAELNHKLERSTHGRFLQVCTVGLGIFCMLVGEFYVGLTKKTWLMEEVRFAQVMDEVFPQYWQPDMPFMLLAGGGMICLWQLMAHLCQKRRLSLWQKYLVVLGRSSLALYVAHYLIGHRLMTTLGISSGFLEGGQMPLTYAFILLALLYVLALPFANWWEHGGISWGWTRSGYPSPKLFLVWLTVAACALLIPWMVGPTISKPLSYFPKPSLSFNQQYEKAQNYYDSGKFEEATHKFKSLLETEIQYSVHELWRVHSALGWSLYRLANYNEALEAFIRSLLLKRGNFFGLYGAGLAYYQLGQYEHATRFLKQALLFDPSNWDLQLAQGWALLRAEEHEKAISMFGKLAQERGYMAEPTLGLAIAEYRAKHLLEAKIALARGIRVSTEENWPKEVLEIINHTPELRKYLEEYLRVEKGTY